ncbi:alpha/beta hydrolase [Halostella salina]|uniref:alpha/beta hydrolase n=1 Tax=Halostella salina TaxID=1547897 RepID=UPI000EF8145E|nr:alpha/beta fold hydrolase [Halostella salina]
MTANGLSRRTVLRLAGAGGLVTLAGCGGSGDDATTTTTDGSNETTTLLTTSDGTSASPTARPGTGTTQPTTGTTTPEATVAGLETTARRFVTDLASGDYGAARSAFAPSAREQVSTDQLETVWTSLERAAGRFVRIATTEHGTVEGRDLISVTVQFRNARQVLNLVFDDEGAVIGFRVAGSPDTGGSWSPPAYADRDAFAETEVSLSATDSCSLPGTLTMPAGEGQVPGVVLVHGSGPSDRDGTIGPNKPLKDLAWGVASRGVAVLRYEKRTAACRVDPATVTIDAEVTDDALTALARLREAERVRPGDTCVVGHSLGAMLAPRIVARSEQLAGGGMLAPPARSLLDLQIQQYEYLATLDGSVSDLERERIDAVRDAVERIRAGEVAEGELVLNAPPGYWESLESYDQVETAASLSRPLFIAQGGRDYQVTVEEDFRRWRDALTRANVTFERYPDLNHLFMPGEGTPNPSEYYRPNHVAEALVADLATWVRGVTGTG